MALPKIKRLEEKMYASAWELFLVLSVWLVAPIVISYFLGTWLDNKYHTKPWLFLTFTIIAFIITSLGIVLQTLKFLKILKKSEKPQTGNNESNRNNAKSNHPNSS